MHKLDTREGNLLADMMLAVRPDWARNRPREVLHRANQAGFAAAHDFGHMVRALAHYATVTGPDGGHRYRTPDLFAEAGEHWTATAPSGWGRPVGRRCEEHPDFEAANCRCCWSEIRDPHMPRQAADLGKALQEPEEVGVRPLSAGERGRLREALSRAAEGMQESAATMQGTEGTA
jgi:hypothetical protein